MTDKKPVLHLDNIVKTFPGVRALDNVSFSVLPGEVHALMGENGAGKSTLMKVLGGIYQPDGGDIYMGDEKAVMSIRNSVLQKNSLWPKTFIWGNYPGRALVASTGPSSQIRPMQS